MKKILVVEDDKFLASAYRIKLARAGFEVQLASDGNEAFVVLQHFLPDLILLDLIMPGKDGFATLMQLKADGRYKHIPVIVASNLGQKEDIEKSMKLGATDFIVKSDISMEQVLNKINALLQAAPAQAPASVTDTAQQAGSDNSKGEATVNTNQPVQGDAPNKEGDDRVR